MSSVEPAVNVQRPGIRARLAWTMRDLIYPGLDLHTRNRATLCRFWGTGPRDVLDAGSGNGYFAWLAYKSGARVVALNMDADQVRKAESFLVEHRGADPARLRFEARNLYDLGSETRTFDEIICYETLEHIRRDQDVCRSFFRLLRPGGVLHACCPYRLHPRHQAEVLDEHETGGHVRPGYTAEDYKQMLEPIGFRVEQIVGLGTPAVYHADRVLRAIRGRLGDFPALPIFPMLLPLAKWARLDPEVPFSLYCRARKPAH